MKHAFYVKRSFSASLAVLEIVQPEERLCHNCHCGNVHFVRITCFRKRLLYGSKRKVDKMSVDVTSEHLLGLDYNMRLLPW
jgi:hypothetical protein